MTTFEETINRDGKLIFTNVGTSMRPLIKQGRDVLIIEKPVFPLKKYDVPLYRRENGQYVLHRIVAVRKDGYVTRGDSRIHREYGVTDDMIIGVLTAVSTDGKEKRTDSKKMKLLSRLTVFSFPLRLPFLILMRLIRKKPEKSE